MYGFTSGSISLAFAIALALAMGPARAAGPALTKPHLPESAVLAGGDTGVDSPGHEWQRDPENPVRPVKRRSFTVGTPDETLLPALDGVKLLGWRGPGATQRSGFDMSVELHGLGLQFEERKTYGYLRADRAFSGRNSVGIQFRYRF